MQPIAIPTVTITAKAVTASRRNEGPYYPKVEVEKEGYSHGMIVLDEMEELLILHDAIDKYIKTNKIKNNYEMEDEEKAQEEQEREAPEMVELIEGYLWANGYSQMGRGNFNPNQMVVKTSQEIVLDLADMADLTLNQVAAAMIYLGYITACGDGKVGWLLKVQREG